MSYDPVKRAMFKLRYEHGWTFKAIAELFGSTPTQVRRWVS